MLIVFSTVLLYGALPTTRDPALLNSTLFRTFEVEHTFWDGNQISTIHGNHGDNVSYHITGNSGLEWPKGSGKAVVFQSGIWIAAGKIKPHGESEWQSDPEDIRTAAAEYTVEFVPGPIDTTYEDGHIYEIHRVEVDAFLNNNYATFSQMKTEIPVTIGTSRQTIEVAFPTDDFINWPAHLGAPYVDANNDRLYNIADGDYPDILGDQFHWYVMNDADASVHIPLWGTEPMNLEIQTSLFGFNQSGALGDTWFLRYVMINDGNDDLDSVFVSMWHDDDVGQADDDLVACDTTLSLGFTYNDADGDGQFGVEAPATGSDFFQGPVVESEGDQAVLLKWNRLESYHLDTLENYRQLPMTSFVKYINGDPDFVDPNTAQEAYNYMNALVGPTGDPYVDPTTGLPTNFVHAGDPVSGTGWIDATPADKRFLMTSGPFHFAPGDTQEVVGCIIVAQGSNWAKSVTKLKYFDKFAQAAFDANFDVCSAAIPTVSVDQLDQKIVLSFEEDSETVEEYTCTDYSFEGYNIYQGESPNGPWHRMVTYDIVNDVKIILDLVLDEDTGELIEVPSQFGSDSGLEHHIEITEDIIRSRDLINYRKYYFAVTSYVYDSEAAQRVIESPFQAVTAIPMGSGLGSDLGSTYGDTIVVNHISGSADLKTYPLVVKPYELTNDDYELFFTYDLVNQTNYWNLVNTTDEDTLFEDKTAFPEESIDITDGFIVTFEDASFDPPAAVKDYSQTVDGDGLDTTSLLFAGDESYWTNNPIGMNYGGGTDSVALLQKDLKFVFTEERQNASVWGLSGGVLSNSVPFELWSMEDSTRINVGILIYTGGESEWDYIDSSEVISVVDGDSVYAWKINNSRIIPIYTDYDPDTTFAIGNDWNGWVVSFSNTGTLIAAGDEFEVYFTNPIVSGQDVFQFTTAGLMTNQDPKAQLKLINVFPNPYFGRNVEETNPLDRFITFTHLGIGAHKVRIFTISGDLIKTIEQENLFENDSGNLIRWDLRNQAGVPVASGMYIAHIDTPYGEKVLKLAVMLPEERLDVY